MDIGVIVYAKDEEEAKDRAEGICEDLCEEGREFDYFKFKQIHLADSKIGKQLIKERFEWTKDDFIENLKRIRNQLDFYTDEELFEEIEDNTKNVDKKVLRGLIDDEQNPFDNPRWFKHTCYNLGQYRGNKIWLYNDDGEGIKTSENLKDALNKFKCIYEDKGKENPHSNDKIFICVFNVHY